MKHPSLPIAVLSLIVCVLGQLTHAVDATPAKPKIDEPKVTKANQAAQAALAQARTNELKAAFVAIPGEMEGMVSLRVCRANGLRGCVFAGSGHQSPGSLRGQPTMSTTAFKQILR